MGGNRRAVRSEAHRKLATILPVSLPLTLGNKGEVSGTYCPFLFHRLKDSCLVHVPKLNASPVGPALTLHIALCSWVLTHKGPLGHLT